jgi:hypothetical protein
LDPGVRRWHRAVIATGLIAVLVPSAWMGYRLVQDEVFQGAAQRALARLEQQTGIALLGRELESRDRVIRLTVVGETEQARLEAAAPALLRAERLDDVKLEFRRVGDAQITDLKERGDRRDQRLTALTLEMRQVNARLDVLATQRMPRAQDLQRELVVWLPNVQGLALSDGGSERRQVHLQVNHALGERDVDRVRAWLTARLGNDTFTLTQHSGPALAAR